jgi:microcystin-dependent protein
MADPYVGEIRLFAFEFPPTGWAFCDGQFVPKDQISDLFDVIGYTYGGSGLLFALPNLQGRAPLQPGAGSGLSPRALAEAGGSLTVTLDSSHLPAHTHEVKASANTGGTGSPEDAVFGASQARALSAGYSSVAPSVALAPAAVESSGGGQAHNNMPPYLPLNFCIALYGRPVI